MVTITEMLNRLNEIGFFSYVLPFLLIFAVVFGLLQKIKIFGDENKAKGINVIVALSIAGISLLFDVVPRFFSIIFPKFGIGLAVFLVLLIVLGFFYMDKNEKPDNKLKPIGWIVVLGVVIWALSEWDEIGGFSYGSINLGSWLNEYLPFIIVIGLIIWAISAVIKSGNEVKER